MIVWIASYPKSGNTWVKLFLSAYLGNQNASIPFDINKMPLSPGKYVIDLIATSGLEVLDYLKDAGQMIVTEGLYYNSGKMPLSGSYPIFFHDFTCKLVSKN